MEANKYTNWFKNNWAILSILLISLGIRIYYFIMTSDQTLWWDEAEYMNIADRFSFGTTYNFGPVRQVLFPFIISIFYHISTSELLPRMLILTLSMLSIFGMYLLGKEVINKRVGLIASFLMSIFYLSNFFTYRLLVDIPSMTFFILSAYFFYKYIKTKNKSSLYLFALMIGIGTLFKLSTAFILLACLIFLIFTEGLRFIKRKEMWIAACIFLLVLAPYIIWGYFEFNGFVLTKASEHVSPESYFNGFRLLSNYIQSFTNYFSSLFLIIFIFGMLYAFYKPLLYFNKLKENKDIMGCLYIFLLLIIPLVLISFMVNHNEDRYILTLFPSVFIMFGICINNLYNMVKDNLDLKMVLHILFVFIMVYVSFNQLTMSDDLIKNKLGSYDVVKEAGIWLSEYDDLVKDGIIATKSQPQMRYYSGLNTVGLPKTEEEFESSLNEQTSYFVLSLFEVHPEWSYTYPERNNLTPIQAYLDKNQQPLLVIYKLK